MYSISRNVVLLILINCVYYLLNSRNVVTYSLYQGSQTHLSMWAVVEDNSQSAGRAPQSAIVLRNTVLTAVES